MDKHVLKSKTINALLILAILLMFNVFDILPVKLGSTYDTINIPSHDILVRAKEVATFVVIIIAIYGRWTAKTGLRIRKGKDKSNEIQN
jgi:hypothetical protein